MSYDKHKAEAAMLERMAEPFTHHQLWVHGHGAGGLPIPPLYESAAYRHADRLIQRERKAGRIVFTRVGRQVLWSRVKSPQP